MLLLGLSFGLFFLNAPGSHFHPFVDDTPALSMIGGPFKFGISTYQKQLGLTTNTYTHTPTKEFSFQFFCMEKQLKMMASEIPPISNGIWYNLVILPLCQFPLRWTRHIYHSGQVGSGQIPQGLYDHLNPKGQKKKQTNILQQFGVAMFNFIGLLKI